MAGLARWAAGSAHESQEFAEECHDLTTVDTPQLRPQQLMKDLKEPDTIQEAIQRMAEHMASGRWQAKAGEQHVKILMAALITTDAPEATLASLVRHEMNLHRALTPQHLGKSHGDRLGRLE